MSKFPVHGALEEMDGKRKQEQPVFSWAGKSSDMSLSRAQSDM